MTKIIRDFTKTELGNGSCYFPCFVGKSIVERDMLWRVKLDVVNTKDWLQNIIFEYLGNLNAFLIFYRGRLIFQDQ